jgi:hypothetical protein
MLLFLIALLFACDTNETTTEVATPKIGEWHPIFNGKDLTGWETMGKLETKVENGELHIHATDPNNNAWVLTQKNYRNFKLECEFLMLDTTANSGVLIRFDKTKTGKPNATAYEANIDWRNNHQNPMGTLENAARANLLEKPNKKDWNKLRIEAKGDLLQVYFNDKKLVETHNRRALTGQIGLQVPIHQGTDISFRNIRVMELADDIAIEATLEETYRNHSKALEPMFSGQNLDGWHILGTGKFTWDDDVLHGYSGIEPSFLVSDKSYKNFYMKFDFKILKEDNSGIFIRKHPDSTSLNLQEDALELNIYDHNGFEHPWSTGSIVFHARSWSNITDYVEWNEMEIFAKDEHVILYINGKKSAESYLPAKFSHSGNICLQAGTRVFLDNSPSDIYFKNMMIREMD